MNQAPEKPNVIVLLGPTASGKTAFSIEIAKIFDCEIISGDSMQIYRGMDIGTAKITADEMQGIPHHLIDIINPDAAFSVAEFQQTARALIDDIYSRGKLPFIVGGTGLYIESVCYDFQFIDIGSDDGYREMLMEQVERNGAMALHQQLALIDRESADRLHPNDVRRVVRAMEIYHISGQTMTALSGGRKQSPYNLCMVGLTLDRRLLYDRINARVDQMLDNGLIGEVENLLREGYSSAHAAMQAIGYKEVLMYLSAEASLTESVTLLKQHTRNYAKRQLSWFRHMPDIEWVDVTNIQQFVSHLQCISGIIAGKFSIDLEYTSKQ